MIKVSRNCLALCWRIGFLIGVAGVLMGCGGRQERDAYYDLPLESTDRRDAYIENQVGAGIDPIEARMMYEREIWIKNTEDQAGRWEE